MSTAPEELRSPAHYVTVICLKGGRTLRKALPWVRGQRLQQYLKSAQMIARRMQSRMVNNAGQRLRMSHIPGPNEEIWLLPPNVPYSYRPR